jgi:uncharacterized membrane protein YphA (DoxX/SURF4 family)
MKTFITLIRWFVGLLFIFSGLIKANDPLGLSYKMQEFFEVWGMHFMNPYTLSLSLLMNVFEVLAGVALIIGWQMKWFSGLLLLLIIFFTFLTGYALFSGKIKTCGCFGDCLPLTPAQSFMKDLLLWALIILIRFSLKSITPLFSTRVSLTLLIVVVVATAGAQGYVLKNAPFVDCLPYKQGNNLLEKMKTPVGAITDSFTIEFTYFKNGDNAAAPGNAPADTFGSIYGDIPFDMSTGYTGIYNIFPSNFPSTSAFLQTISPLTLPAGPITIFPSDLKFPTKSPSSRKSAWDKILPLITVPSTILLVFPSKAVYDFAFLANIIYFFSFPRPLSFGTNPGVGGIPGGIWLN